MPSSEQKSSLRVLAFDFGTRRIGVAVGQAITQTATPLTPLRACDGIPDWNELTQLISTWQPDAFLVGLPLTMEGEEGDMVTRARKFAKRLHGRYHKTCYEMDERLSSYEAEQAIREHPTNAGDIDSVAASVILESWFRQQAVGTQ